MKPPLRLSCSNYFTRLQISAFTASFSSLNHLRYNTRSVLSKATLKASVLAPNIILYESLSKVHITVSGFSYSSIMMCLLSGHAVYSTVGSVRSMFSHLWAIRLCCCHLLAAQFFVLFLHNLLDKCRHAPAFNMDLRVATC